MASIPDGVIFMWPGNNSAIPTDWSRVTSLDAKFPQGTADGVNPGTTTGGSATHTHSASAHTHSTIVAHTHGGTSGITVNEGGKDTTQNSGVQLSQSAHSHTATTSSDTGTGGSAATPAWSTNDGNMPAYYTVCFVESDGATDIADDLICYYNSGSTPADWSQHGASVGKFFYGAAGGGNGGGSDSGGSHVHTSASHSHGSSGNHDHDVATSGAGGSTYASTNNSGSVDAVVQNHTHTVTTDTSGAVTIDANTGASAGSATYNPPYHKLQAIQNTSGGALWLEGAIGLWVGAIGDIPEDWLLCDGSNSTPDLRSKFILNDASGGGDHGGTGTGNGHDPADGGGHTHTTPAHNHTGTLTPNSGTRNIQISGPASQAFTDHAHETWTTNNATPATSSATEPITAISDSRPPFRAVVYIQAPEEPVLPGSTYQIGANF